MKLLSCMLILLGCFAVFSSCSNNLNPITSSGTPDTYTDEVASSPLIMGRNSSAFGLWKIRIDPETMSAEIIPARNAGAIGDIFDADLSQFLTYSPCANCLAVGRVFLDLRQHFNIEFKIKHPFANITSRPDLHGFDVRLIFIIEAYPFGIYDGIDIMRPDGSTEPANLDSSYILNPDGYTSHFDELVLDERYFQEGTDIPGNLNPFVRFFESDETPDFDPHAPVGQNVMSVGALFDTQTVTFNAQALGAGIEVFAVADVAYGQSATFTNRDNPQYYLPAFHRTEAWRMEYWIENNNLSWADPLSTADIVVQVFDWQHGGTVDTAYPDPANLSGLPESSNVLAVELQASTLQNAVVIANTPESGTGSPSDPLQYRLTVTNENLATYNTSGLLAIRDELYGLAAPSGRYPIPETPAGFPYDTQDILDYSLYEIIIINMPEPSFNVQNEGEFSAYPYPAYANNNTASLNGLFFMDFSGRQFQYRWDFDYDGVTFDVDASGIPTPEHEFIPPGLHNTAVRVRTNTVPPHEYIYELPVYSEGLAFDRELHQSGTNNTMLSQTVGRNVAITDDHFYVVFTTDEGAGVREIVLAIWNRNNSGSTRSITFGHPTPCFNPSILVIDEDSPVDGVYVVFETYDSGTFDLLSTFGTLDGDDFFSSNIKPVDINGSADAYQPDLIRYSDRLLAYYTYTELPAGSDVHVASSVDFGLTWTVHGTPVNDTTDHYQIRPTAFHSNASGKTFCIWEDYSDAARGSDLIASWSFGGLAFLDEINLSNFPGQVWERHAVVDGNASDMAIVYQTEDTLGERDIWLKTCDFYLTSATDYKVSPFNIDHMTRPTVSSPVPGRYLVSYGIYDEISEELNAYIVDIKAGTYVGGYSESTLLNIPVGVVVPDAAQIYPGIASRSIGNDACIEHFVTYMSFNDGVTESNNPFPMHLGDINVSYIITDGIE